MRRYVTELDVSELDVYSLIIRQGRVVHLYVMLAACSSMVTLWSSMLIWIRNGFPLLSHTLWTLRQGISGRKL